MVKIVGVILAIIPVLLGLYFGWGAYEASRTLRTISLSPQIDATLSVACFVLSLVIIQIGRWIDQR